MTFADKIKIPENLVPVFNRINEQMTNLNIRIEGNVIDVKESKLDDYDIEESLRKCRIPFVAYKDDDFEDFSDYFEEVGDWNWASIHYGRDFTFNGLDGLKISDNDIRLDDAAEVVTAFYNNNLDYFNDLREKLKPRIEAVEYTSGRSIKTLNEYLSVICQIFGGELDDSFSYQLIECLIDELKEQNKSLWVDSQLYEIAQTLADSLSGQKEMLHYSVRLPHIVYRFIAELNESKHPQISTALKKEMPDNYDPFSLRAGIPWF